jgi:hypothetical protein
MKNTLSLSDLWLSFGLCVQRVVGDVVIHVQTTELSKRKTVIEMACPPAHVIKQVGQPVQSARSSGLRVSAQRRSRQ